MMIALVAAVLSACAKPSRAGAMTKKDKALCECQEQTGRYPCASRFGHDHCPDHCMLCFPRRKPRKR